MKLFVHHIHNRTCICNIQSTLKTQYDFLKIDEILKHTLHEDDTQVSAKQIQKTKR